jgi:hypothetical protein
VPARIYITSLLLTSSYVYAFFDLTSWARPTHIVFHDDIWNLILLASLHQMASKFGFELMSMLPSLSSIFFSSVSSCLISCSLTRSFGIECFYLRRCLVTTVDISWFRDTKLSSLFTVTYFNLLECALSGWCLSRITQVRPVYLHRHIDPFIFIFASYAGKNIVNRCLPQPLDSRGY